jgi:Mg-chelatase subunit ChlD
MKPFRYVFAFWMTSFALMGCPSDGGNSATATIFEDPGLVSATGEFTATTGELAISVSPTDADGNFVGQGLPASAFAFEDVTIAPTYAPAMTTDVATAVTGTELNEPDPTMSFAGAVIFDSSGSMASNDPGAVGRRAGGQALFDVLRDNDELAVLDFGAGSTAPFRETRIIQDFTSDRMLLDASLDELQSSGGTPLFASIIEGLSLLEDRSIQAPSLVVLTDGQASDANLLEQAIADAQSLSVPIYAIGLGQSLDYSLLTRLANETSGGFIEASDAMALEQAFAGVSSGLRLGSVVVRGEGTYMLPNPYGMYRVSGTLVTTDARGTRFETPFSLTTEIQ